MRRLARRALLGAVGAGLVVVLGATPVPAGVGTRLVNGAGATSNKCMSIENTGRGNLVLLETCNLNAHQGWVLTPVRQYVQVRSQDQDAGGKCLTANFQGNQVYMSTCLRDIDPDSVYQEWFVDRIGTTAWFQLQNATYGDGSAQCLDVRDNGRSNVVQTWGCGPDNKGNQMWKFW